MMREITLFILVFFSGASQADIRYNWINPTYPRTGFSDIVVIDQNEFYSCGKNMMHYEDGNLAYHTFTNPNEYIEGADFKDNIAWFLGDYNIYYWPKGAQPQVWGPTPGSQCRDIVSLGNGELMVSSNRHVLYVYHNGQWRMENPVGLTWPAYSKIERAPGDLYIICCRHVLVLYDTVSWTVLNTRQPNLEIHAVSYISPTDIWVAGQQIGTNRMAKVYHYDGTSWQDYRDPLFHSAVTDVTEIIAFGIDDVWGMNIRSLFHYDGTTWSQIIHPACFQKNPMSWTAMDNIGHSFFIGTSNGHIFNTDESGQTNFPITEFYYRVESIAGESEDDIWAATNCALLYFDGKSWIDYTNNTCTLGESSYFIDIEYLSQNDIYFAGGGPSWNDPGFLCHYDGLNWSKVRDFPHRVKDACILSDKEMWIGVYDGPNSLVYRYNGIQWDTYSIPVSIRHLDFADLNTVFMTVAGPHSDALFTYKNGSWTKVPNVEPVGHGAYMDLKVVSKNEVYLLSACPTLFLYDGNITHILYTEPYCSSTRGKMQWNSRNDVWLQSAYSFVHYNGSTWESFDYYDYLYSIDPWSLFFKNDTFLMGGNWGTVVSAKLTTPTPTTPNPTLTPIIETPSPTPTALSDTPTATPNLNPAILLAGYWDTRLSAASGGVLGIFALAREASEVEVMLSGSPTGVSLPVYDLPNGIFWLQNVSIAPGVPAGRITLELQPKYAGAIGVMWPYLTVGP